MIFWFPAFLAKTKKGVQIKAHHKVSRFKWSVFFCFCLWYFDLVKLSLQRFFVDRFCPRFLARGSLCQTLARMPPRRIISFFFWMNENLFENWKFRWKNLSERASSASRRFVAPSLSRAERLVGLGDAGCCGSGGSGSSAMGNSNTTSVWRRFAWNSALCCM